MVYFRLTATTYIYQIRVAKPTSSSLAIPIPPSTDREKKEGKKEQNVSSPQRYHYTP